MGGLTMLEGMELESGTKMSHKVVVPGSMIPSWSWIAPYLGYERGVGMHEEFLQSRGQMEVSLEIHNPSYAYITRTTQEQ